MMQAKVPDPAVRRRLSGASLVDDRGVRKAYAAPERCRPSTLERVRAAAVALGVDPPPRAEAR